MFNQNHYYLSPAKINLFLHVLNRRDDGYHELQTMFQLLNYGDELKFKVNESGVLGLHQSIENEGQKIPMDQNLIIKAANLLRNEIGNPGKGADITIRKKIPIGAGLGGGSSNAGTTLKILNQLWDCNFSNEELGAIGSQLGADQAQQRGFAAPGRTHDAGDLAAGNTDIHTIKDDSLAAPEGHALKVYDVI